ncbi:hypothetical protein RN001_004097 [Aquatica leii]|uniref:Kazal-like domain-containing protein n=1 Tax=Aquatica leii TaxID=1421715 RepID=A0AAN7PRU7_9COLE|nr:hypothetical protein RN001_004097 [Aquatica leii]
MKCFLIVVIFCQIATIWAQFSFGDYDEFDTGNNGNNGNWNNNNQNNNNNNNNNMNIPANYNSCYGSCSAMVIKEYNPVCASNQITYDNRRLLGCAQQCGLRIVEISQSTCRSTAGGK